MSDPAGRSSRLLAYRWLLLLAALIFGLDQATKAWIAFRLPSGGGEAIPVIPGFFDLIHVGNTGAAWSLFTGRSVLLALLAAGTLVAIYVGRSALGLPAVRAQVAFGLLCGGIAGNLTDRIARGHVVDFLDFHFGRYAYPTFNVADSAICVGVAWYAWYSLRGK
jgi:signal peptidase II